MLNTEKNIRIVTQLGLTVNQAKAYLILVKLGPTNAKEISKASAIAQQDIYRLMPELQKLGLVEKMVASPTLFKANSPEQTLSVLLKRKEKEDSMLHHEALALIERLNESKKDTGNEQHTSQFSIITGKKTILMRSRKAISEANKSIYVLTTWKNSAKNTQHFLALCKKALNRQVKIRFILYMPREEALVFSRMMRHLTEDPRLKVKFIFAEKPIIFSVFDAKQVFFSTQKGNLGNVPILWSNNPSFAAWTEDYFDRLWAVASESLEDNTNKTQ